MRNLCLVDSYVAKCSLLKTCQAATVERNIIYFSNENEICKLEMDSLNPENDVSCFYLLQIIFFNLSII